MLNCVFLYFIVSLLPFPITGITIIILQKYHTPSSKNDSCNPSCRFHSWQTLERERPVARRFPWLASWLAKTKGLFPPGIQFIGGGLLVSDSQLLEIGIGGYSSATYLYTLFTLATIIFCQAFYCSNPVVVVGLLDSPTRIYVHIHH